MRRDRVLEIGHHAAGYCGKLFAHAGYEVVRVEPSGRAPAWASEQALELFLHAGKRRLRGVDSATLSALADAADVVIVEAAGADALADAGFEDWRTPVRVTITPYGATGPRRNDPATPHTLLAEGGYTYLMGDADRAPLSLPGHYLEFQSGTLAFVAANAARLSGSAARIDIGMLEVVMMMSQFTTSVNTSPLGRVPTLAMHLGSIASIIGKIITQISAATARLIRATSHCATVSAIDGASLPIATPTAIASATQSDK